VQDTVGHDAASGPPPILPGSSRQRAVVGTLGVIALCVVLAGLRPQVTYHLAPALVVWSVPFLSGGRGLRFGSGLAAAAFGVLAAVTTATALALLGWSQGPALFGGDATAEAMLVALAAGLLVPLVVMVRGAGSSAIRTEEPEGSAGSPCPEQR
jgi:hypothetical protein